METVDDLLALLARGDAAFDEPDIDVLAHGLQCGAILRARHPDDPQLAVAGLVHDIADIPDIADIAGVAGATGHDAHDRVGAALVEPLLGARVARLVGAHVLAKRYLVTIEPSYRARLSARSIETLAAQGGTLDDETWRRLDADPDRDAILALRRADERAKDPRARVPGLETWRPLLVELAQHR